MLAIYRKELRSYFINPIGYIYLGVFLVAAAALFYFTVLSRATYNTALYFTILVGALVVLIPLLTMRLFAEERKLRTEQLLLTAPVTLTGMVLGKYFAALTVYAAGVLASCINFIPLYVIGAAEQADQTKSLVSNVGPVTGEILGGVFALLLVGAALIAVGTFISSLTENQLSAAVISVGVIGGMTLIGLLNTITDANGQPWIRGAWIRTVLSWVSVLSRFAGFTNGIFDFAALFYYLSLAFVFLFFTIRVYEKRRWA